MGRVDEYVAILFIGTLSHTHSSGLISERGPRLDDIWSPLLRGEYLGPKTTNKNGVGKRKWHAYNHKFSRWRLNEDGFIHARLILLLGSPISFPGRRDGPSSRMNRTLAYLLSAICKRRQCVQIYGAVLTAANALVHRNRLIASRPDFLLL